MDNTKALEVGRITFGSADKPAMHEHFAGAESLTETIRTLRTQLAERDAQLAALQTELERRTSLDREIKEMGLVKMGDYDTRQPTQDKGEE